MKEKSRVTAAILAICLGGYSAHYFYLGNNRAKKRLILAIVTFGVMAMVYSVMGIIDGIKFLQMNDETFAEYCAAIPEKNEQYLEEKEKARRAKGSSGVGNMNQVIGAVKRRSESVCEILFYIVAGLCFVCCVGDFNGGFMPVMGSLLAMILEVAIWLLIPVLISIRRRSIAKWAFLGLSIYWALTTIFSLLRNTTQLATANMNGLSVATGVFGFLIACTMIVATVFAALGYWKKDRKLKRITLAIYFGTLLFFLVFFALRIAGSVRLNDKWSIYFNLVYNYFVIPFAMLFAALSYWLSESDLHFACFDREPVTDISSPKGTVDKVLDDEHEDVVVEEDGDVVEEREETTESELEEEEAEEKAIEEGPEESSEPAEEAFEEPVDEEESAMPEESSEPAEEAFEEPVDEEESAMPEEQAEPAESEDAKPLLWMEQAALEMAESEKAEKKDED